MYKNDGNLARAIGLHHVKPTAGTDNIPIKFRAHSSEATQIFVSFQQERQRCRQISLKLYLTPPDVDVRSLHRVVYFKQYRYGGLFGPFGTDATPKA